jgi:hypothetical protein
MGLGGQSLNGKLGVVREISFMLQKVSFCKKLRSQEELMWDGDMMKKVQI